MEIKGVTKTIAEYIRTRIIVGEFRPGQKLNENHLASMLNVSRGPIREAFKFLENERLAVNMPRKGTRVSEISIDDCNELYETRQMMELFAIDLLKAKKMKGLPNLGEYVSAAHDLKISTDSTPEEKVSYFKATVDFHINLVKSAGNKRLLNLFATLLHGLHRYQYKQWSNYPSTKNVSYADHKSVIDSIELGAYVEAKKVLTAHIKKAFDLVVSELDHDKILVDRDLVSAEESNSLLMH